MNLGQILEIPACLDKDTRTELQKACDSVTMSVRRARTDDAEILMHDTNPAAIDQSHAEDMRDAMIPIRKAFSGRIIRRSRADNDVGVPAPVLHTLSLVPLKTEKSILDQLWQELDEKGKKRALAGGQVSTPCTIRSRLRSVNDGQRAERFSANVDIQTDHAAPRISTSMRDGNPSTRTPTSQRTSRQSTTTSSIPQQN